jgi:hypothetical protein
MAPALLLSDLVEERHGARIAALAPGLRRVIRLT